MFGSERLLTDGERSAQEGLGFGRPLCLLQQCCQIVERHSNVGMLGTKALLVNGQCAAIERLGLRPDGCCP